VELTSPSVATGSQGTGPGTSDRDGYRRRPGRSAALRGPSASPRCLPTS